MSIDKAKALKAAQKYLARGQLDRAIVEFEKIVADDPNDARSLLKLGDIYTRQGDQRGAAATYRKVAAQYAEQGFFLKAMAVYKQILKLDPDDLAASESLGEMYEALSLTNDAIATYEVVADAHARAGTPEKSLNVLERLTSLDKENIAAWIRYAEMLSKSDRIDEAAEAFRRGADLLKAQDRIDDYIKVTERLLFHSHEDVGRARDLARVYIERGQAKAALPHLQTCFKADSRDPATLSLLALAFESLGQTAKAASVYRELVRVHAEHGRAREERSALRKLRELDPENSDVLARLRALDATLPEPPQADDQLEVVEMDDVELIDEEAAAPIAPQDQKAQVKRLMDECEVFLRYGLRDKIVAQLNRVLELDPNHVEAREKLRDTYVKRGETDAAVQQLLLLSDVVAQKDLAQSVRYLEQAAKLQPNNSTVAARLRHSRLPPPAALRDDDDQVVLVSEEPDESDFSDLASEPPTALRANQVIIPSEQDSDSEPELLLEPTADEVEVSEADLEPADAELQPVDADEAANVELTTQEMVAEPSPAHDPWQEEQQVPAEAAAEPAAGFPTGTLPPPPLAAPADLGATEAVSDEELPEAIADVLEEAEFYRSQRLFDEAREVLDEARSVHGDHPALLAKQAELDGPPSGAHAAPPPPAATTAGSSPPAAVESARPAQPPIEVGDVLKQFKDGVRRQVDGSDAATHYDLGIAYMEMGLHAEAIEEFSLCLDAPEKQRTAHTMIGLSNVARGEMALGITHFEQALALPGSSTDEELDLWFEIGNAYELLGQGPDALVWYQKVRAENPSFRDIAARVQRLEVAKPVYEEVDEFDAMFDNMIMKD